MMSNVQPIRKTMPFAPPYASPSMNEGPESDDFVIGAAWQALQAVRLAAEGMRGAMVAIHMDQTLSPGAAHLKSDDVSYKLIMRTLPQVDRANAGLQTEINRLRQKTSAPAIDTSVRGLGLAGEVRQALARMDDKTRRAAIASAVQELDEVTIGAVLTAPRILIGMSELDVDHLREQWRRKALPAECARIEALERAQGHLLRGGSLLQGYQRQCSDQSVVAMAKRTQQAAADAIAKSGAYHHDNRTHTCTGQRHRRRAQSRMGSRGGCQKGREGSMLDRPGGLKDAHRGAASGRGG